MAAKKKVFGKPGNGKKLQGMFKQSLRDLPSYSQKRGSNARKRIASGLRHDRRAITKSGGRLGRYYLNTSRPTYGY